MAFSMTVCLAGCTKASVSYDKAMETFGAYIESNGNVVDGGDYRIEKKDGNNREFWYQIDEDGEIGIAISEIKAKPEAVAEYLVISLPKVQNVDGGFAYAVKKSENSDWENAWGKIELATVNGPTTSAVDNTGHKLLVLDILSMDNSFAGEEEVVSYVESELETLMKDFSKECKKLDLNPREFGFTNYKG